MRRCCKKTRASNEYEFSGRNFAMAKKLPKLMSRGSLAIYRKKIHINKEIRCVYMWHKSASCSAAAIVRTSMETFLGYVRSPLPPV